MDKDDENKPETVKDMSFRARYASKSGAIGDSREESRSDDCEDKEKWRKERKLYTEQVIKVV